MLTSKRALVPRRLGTGRQTTFRSFAVNPSDFDCLVELGAGPPGQENEGTSRDQTAPIPPESTQPAAAKLLELPTAQHAADQLRSPLRKFTQVPATPVAANPAFAVAGVVTANMRAAQHQPVAPRRLLCDMERTWHSRGSGRITKRYNFSTSIKPLEQAEQQYRAKLAAEAAAEEARIRAAAEAAAKAEAEAKEQADAARQAEEEARAAAEAEEAARLAAEAEAAALAEAAARAAADEEAKAVAEAQARAAAEAEELVRAAAEAEAARMEAEAQAAEAARLAAGLAAAAVAAATPVAAKAARAVAKTPGSSFVGWSPIEGIPEMHTRPRTRCAAKAAAAAAATPGQSWDFTPVEGVPETARGFRRSSGRVSESSQKHNVLCKTAFTPIEGVPEKDTSFQRTPFDKQLQRAGAAEDKHAPGEASLMSPVGDTVEGGEEVTAAEMAAALQQVDSMVAGIVSASPNTPATHPLPVYLTSMPRTRALEAAAASFYRHTADKPGHMNVAIQYSAGRSARCGAQQGSMEEDAPAAACRAGASGGDADATGDAAAAEAAGSGDEDTPGDVAAALWDDDGDEYAGAGGDYSDDAADLDAAAAAADADSGSAADTNRLHDHAADGVLPLGVASPAGLNQQHDQEASLSAGAVGGGSGASVAVNSHSAGALSPPARLTPEAVQPAAADTTAAAATRRRVQSVTTPREGRQAKSRKSLAGDGLTMGADGRRVSKRTRHKPLEFWRSEKVEYVRDHRTLPTVKRYVSKTPDPIWPAPSNQQVRRARSKLSQKQKEQQNQQQTEQQHRDEAEEEEEEEELTHAAAGSSAAAAAATSSVGAKKARGRPAGKSNKKAKR